MKIGDSARMAMANLARRPARTALTLVGVVIGVAALVLMISLAIGLEREVLRLFQAEEVLRTLFVERPRSGGSKNTGRITPFQFGVSAVPMTDRDLQELRGLPGVELVVPDLGLILDADIVGKPGSTQRWLPVGGVPMEEAAGLSRFLKAGAVWTDEGERALLMPSHILARFDLKPEEAVGKKLVFTRAFAEDEDHMEEATFLIRGVLDSERLGLRGIRLLLPMPRAVDVRERMKGGNMPLITRRDQYPSAEVRVRSVADVEDVRNRLRNSGYEVLSVVDIIDTIRTIFLVIEGFMACIGAIGLIVSIFGIANTMAMAVLERTREIGILKALGARNADVRRIFLLEAGAIGLIGGLIGLGAGTVVGLGLNVVARQLFETPRKVNLFHVSLWLAVGAVLFAVLVSMAAGFLPARRAARLDPVRALRHE